MNSKYVSNIYVGTDGKLHKVIGGADTVLPFSNGVSSLNKIYEVYMITNASCSVNIGHMYLACCILDGNSYDLSVTSGGEIMSRNTWIWYNDRSTQLLLKATNYTLVLVTNHDAHLAVFEVQ